MKSNRKRTTLGDLVRDGSGDYQTGPFGTMLKASEYSSEGTPLISVSEIREGYFTIYDHTPRVCEKVKTKLPQFVLEEGDIVFGRKGAINRNAIIMKSQEGWFLGSDGIRLRLTHKHDPAFFSYFLRTKMIGQWLLSNGQGAIMPSLNQKILDRLPLFLPSKAEQRRISNVLATFDAKIELNNQINAELEGVAKLLYDYWFVQFDFPISAVQAADMGKPELKGKPYRASGGKMSFNEKLKREIPGGWEISTVGQTFKTYLGGTPSRDIKEYWNPGEVNWLSSGENPGTFVLAPDEKISKLGLQNSPAKLLPAGTVILSIVRHLRASILGIEAATNQSVVGIVESNTINHCFIYPYIIREIPRLMLLRTGAQQPHINKGVLDESLLVVPDEFTLAAYTRLTEPLFLEIRNHHQQNKELTKLRDWLLPMLMNGQVTVSS